MILKRVKVLVLLIGILCCFACSNQVVIVYDISSERFEREIAESRRNFTPFLILDMRDESAYLGGHILDALNYPIATLKTRVSEISDLADLPVYVYGTSADESFIAAKVLAQNGFTKVYNCEGIDEANYTLYFHNPIRLKTGFQLAADKGYKLVDYRTKEAHRDYGIDNANFIPFPNLYDIVNLIEYADGYVVFSTNSRHARDCALTLVNYGFQNVYYCIDNVLDYPEYLPKTEKTKRLIAP